MVIAPLFGLEEELHFVVFDDEGRSMPHAERVRRLTRVMDDALRPEGLPADHQYGGWFLPNGSRAYYDAWPRGGNFEYSTAEHTDLLRLCADLCAGRRLFRDLGRRLAGEPGIARVELYACGVDYQRPLISSGLHVNHFREADRPIAELTSHFASLPALTGVGGFATRSGPSLEFVCSPRADHITRVESSDSSGGRRGLVDTYRKPYGRGRRVQEINGDGNQSIWQIAVRVGSTALLLALVDHWGLSLDALRLRDPLAALGVWNRDPSGFAPLVRGGPITAVELQRRLHELVVRQLRAPRGAAPAWAGPLTEWWDLLIEEAAAPSAAEPGRLDWRMLRGAIDAVCAEHSVDPAELAPIETARRLLPAAGDDGSDTAEGAGSAQVRAVLDRHGIGCDRFVFVVDELAPLLHLLCLRYQELGPDGLHAQVQPGLPPLPGLTEDLIDEVRTAPPSTRARVRGRFVSRHSGQAGYSCRWDALISPSGRRRLDDPYDADVDADDA